MTLLACVLASLAVSSPAAEPEPPGSHLWIVNELFSNADGTVQFVELWECCGSSIETQMAGKDVFSDASSFTFPANLTGDTAYRFLLLGTAGYAALSGVPAPDYVIPDGFFSAQGDTVRWHIYPNATVSFDPGAFPLGSLHSLNHDGTTGINSPTNYAGETGMVNLVSAPALPLRWLVVLLAGALVAGVIVLRQSASRSPA